MAQPDFLVIGAPDTGTELLMQGLRHWDAGLRHWGAGVAAAPDPNAIPCLLADFPALRRLHERLPYVRLVAVLRDPATRAYAHWTRMRAAGLESIDDFERALAAEDERTAAAWDWPWRYLALGCYGAQVQRLFSLFGQRQVLLLSYGRLWTEPAAVLEQVARFVGPGRPAAGAAWPGAPQVARLGLGARAGSWTPAGAVVPAGGSRMPPFAQWSSPTRLDPDVAARVRARFHADHMLLEQVTGHTWDFGPDPG
jgi:hypothetical protein